MAVMNQSPSIGSALAKLAEASATKGLLCIPVGPMTVRLPETLSGLVAGPPPWPVILAVWRVWVGQRDKQWELHFGEVVAQPLPPPCPPSTLP